MPVHSYTPPPGAEAPVVRPDAAAAAIVGAPLPRNGSGSGSGTGHGLSADDVAGGDGPVRTPLPGLAAAGEFALDGTPLTGPALFEHRRALWTTGRLPASSSLCPPASPPLPSSPARIKRHAALDRLDAALAVPRAEESDELWHAGGLKGVHRSLTDGKRLVVGMRLGLVIKILRAGWVQDGTWPSGGVKGERRAVDAPYDPFWD